MNNTNSYIKHIYKYIYRVHLCNISHGVLIQWLICVMQVEQIVYYNQKNKIRNKTSPVCTSSTITTARKNRGAVSLSHIYIYIQAKHYTNGTQREKTTTTSTRILYIIIIDICT